ncbi:MAG: hypothetical protein J5I47_01635 [Vicingus serpentipes]|nr:hypothetical protein [Vicingus serpentipes]
MKQKLIFIYLLLTTVNYTFGQNPNVLNYKEIRVNGINWESTLDDIIQQFGQPDTAYDPKFECGAYSTEQQDIDSVALYHYPKIDFLIVDSQVVFRDIYFDENNTISLKTQNLKLDYNTTTDELKKLFPNSYKHWLTDEYGILRLWPCNYCDDEIWLHIKDGHIKRIQFWDPC